MDIIKGGILTYMYFSNLYIYMEKIYGTFTILGT